jgi:signal transduction histidine kinase
MAVANYWNLVRTAETTLQSEQEARLADFKNQVNKNINEDRGEFTRLSRAPTLISYLRQTKQNETGGTSAIAAQSSSSEPLPPELKVRLATLLNSQSHVSIISLFDWNRHALFVVEKKTDAEPPILFQTRDFFSQQPQPDQRIWTTPGLVFSSSAESAAAGGHVVLTTAVPADEEASSPQGALVADLKLDEMFSEAAIDAELSATPLASNNKAGQSMFIVLDRNGRIVYHTNGALKHRPASEAIPYFQPVAQHMLSSDLGQERFTTPDGTEYAVSYSQIPTIDVSVALVSDRNQALAEAHRAGRIGLLISVLLGFLAAVLLARYWRYSARGLERVTEGVMAIAGGQLDHRIEARSSDNIRLLAENVNIMTEQMRDQIAREAETRQFQSFVRLSAMLTHDLKNAIEALSLTVTNIERHFDDRDFRVDAMKTLSAATQNLRGLVARLSDPISTLSGEHRKPGPVDLVPVLKRVISMTAEPASEQHEIRIELPSSLFALVDGERIGKVIQNLIINALESMEGKRGILTVRAGHTEDGKSFFSVSDTGEGMSPRFIERRLFRPFATTKKKGVGLGLYTCREVVQANGGTIEVDSQRGVGTTFKVVLPSVELDERDNEQHPSRSHS